MLEVLFCGTDLFVHSYMFDFLSHKINKFTLIISDSKQDSDSTSEISSQTSKKRCLPSLAQVRLIMVGREII